MTNIQALPSTKPEKLTVARYKDIRENINVLIDVLEAVKPVSGLSESFEPALDDIEQGLVKRKLLELVNKLE